MAPRLAGWWMDTWEMLEWGELGPVLVAVDDSLAWAVGVLSGNMLHLNKSFAAQAYLGFPGHG